MPLRIPGKSKLISLAAALVVALAVFAAPASSSAPADHELMVPPAPPAIQASAAGVAPPAPPAPPVPPAPPAERRRADRDRHDRRAWLGIVLSGEDGTRVRSVAGDSPAEQAGLEKGDRILEIEGEEIEEGQDIFRAMRGLTPGDRVRIRVERDGTEKTLSATLGDRRESFRGESGPRVFEFEDDDDDDGDDDGDDEDMHQLKERYEIMIPGPGRNFLGVEILMMSEDLRSALKAPRERGVLVNKVVEGSPADEGGIRAGDIIVSVDGEAIEDAGDIGTALREHEPGTEVDVKVIRDGSERTLDVKVERRPGRQGRRGSLGWEGFSEKEREELRRTVGEAMKQAGEAMRQAHEAMKERGLEMRQIQEQLRDQNLMIREQIRKQLEEVRPTVRARNVHDI